MSLHGPQQHLQRAKYGVMAFVCLRGRQISSLSRESSLRFNSLITVSPQIRVILNDFREDPPCLGEVDMGLREAFRLRLAGFRSISDNALHANATPQEPPYGNPEP